MLCAKINGKVPINIWNFLFSQTLKAIFISFEYSVMHVRNIAALQQSFLFSALAVV